MKKLLLLLFVLTAFSSEGQTTASLFCSDSTHNGYLSGYYLNNNVTEYGMGACNNMPAMCIAIISDTNCTPVDNLNKNFGQLNTFDGTTGNCRPRAQYYFVYQVSDSIQMLAMAHLLDSVTPGNYILAYTWMSPIIYSKLDTSFKSVFKRLGSVMMNTLNDSDAFIFFCQKGSISSVVEKCANYSVSYISLSATLTCILSGIDEIGKNVSVSLSPNPFHSTATLSISGLTPYPSPKEKGEELKIYDVMGRLVQSASPILWRRAGVEAVINREGLADGLYYYQLRTTDSELIAGGKFVVE